MGDLGVAPAVIEPFDEALDRAVVAQIERVGVVELAERVAAAATATGVSFGGDRPFHVDPVPRVFGSDEWSLLEAGVIQRTLALEAFVADVYSERRLVFQPRAGQGGHSVVVGPHAKVADLRDLAHAVRRDPHDYVAQDTIMLSRHPTVIDGRLEPRHVDLRPFVFLTPGAASVVPGGLTRVALDRGALVVNSSQRGGGKDTWVLW